MRLPLASAVLLLVASACVLPTSEEDGELAEQTSALAIQQGSRLPLQKENVVHPQLAEQFAQRVAELRCRENPSEARAYFVVPRRFAVDLRGEGNYCLDVPGTNGTWYGEPAFPGVVTSLCRYEWGGTTAPEYLPLALSAARQPDSLRLRITADCRQVRPTCRSVASCAAATPARGLAPGETFSHFTPEPLPCPACRGTVASRKLIAVLSPEIAGGSLVSAETFKDGRWYTATFRPSGSQVDSYDIPEDFPDTTEVQFRPVHAFDFRTAP